MRIAMAQPVVGEVPPAAQPYHLGVAAEIGGWTKDWLFIVPDNVSPHDAARVRCVEEAEEKGIDYLVFVDADTLWPNGGFRRLMEVMLERRPAVVTGRYYRRGWPYDCVWSKGQKRVDAKSGVHAIDCAGLGCAIIDMKWILQHLSPPFFTTYIEGKQTAVFDDVSFYRKVRAADGVILGVADVFCAHLGQRIHVDEESANHYRAMHMKGMY